MQGKYKTKKCSKGIKKIKKASNGLQITDDEGNLTSGASNGMGIAGGLGAMTIEGLTSSKYDSKYTSQLKDENQALGRGIGAGVGQATNLLIPGLGTAITPLLSSAGGAIQRGLQGNKLEKLKKNGEYQDRVAKANENIGTDLTSFQAKQYKSGGKVKSKVIEIEGKETPEIHTDANFNIKNLGTTPHSKGGNKVMAEEGDIVFPTQNSSKKYNEIMTAIKNKDKYKLKKEQNKLPEDKASKYDRGSQSIKGSRKNPDLSYDNYIVPQELDDNYKGYSPLMPQPLNQTGWLGTPFKGKQAKGASKSRAVGKQIKSSKSVLSKPLIGNSDNADLTGLEAPKDRNTYAKIDVTKPTEKTEQVLSGDKEEPKKGSKGLGLNDAMELAPIAYNLGQGLFGKTEKVNRREYNPTLENYVDTSSGTRREINQGYKANVANARNLSGGLGSNMRANAQAASNAKVSQINSVDSQEYGKQLDVNNRNTGLLNNAKLTNLELNNNYDNLNAQNRAKKGEALSQGLTELGDVGYRNKSDSNKLKAQSDALNILKKGTSYKVNSDEEGQNLDIEFENGTGIPTLTNNLLDNSKVKKTSKKSKGSKGIQVERKYKIKK